jgi:DcuC family C4-dicarboxylate transporter
LFDIGPSSANTAKAAELAELSTIGYFVEHQLPIVVPLTILLVVLYYFTSRYHDKRDVAKGKSSFCAVVSPSELKVDVPLIYAILPLLPLALLVVFSKYIHLFGMAIELDTTTAMIISLFIAMIFEFVRKRNLTEFFNGAKMFWEGAGKIFTDVVTLIVCAEIFGAGLIGLGFIEALVTGATHMNLSGDGVGILIAVVIFMAAMLMGSGNAAFFSFGPLIPNIAKQFGLQTSDLITPIQLSSSMGRAVSPIAGFMIAISEIVGISSFDLAKRNAIPLVTGLIFMLLYNYWVLG